MSPDKLTGGAFLNEWDDFVTRCFIRHRERISGVEVGSELFEAVCDAQRELGYESEILSESTCRRVTAGGATIITRREK